MTVREVRHDPQGLTLTILSEFDAPVERVWQVWADPRQLERWWGPPTHPATVVDHDLTPGARVSYYMTGPEGDKYPGWWRIISVDPPHRLTFEDGFADDDGEAADDMPTTVTEIELEAGVAGSETAGTTMTMVSVFPTAEAMKQILAMGAEEGMKLALGQIDSILAA